MVTVIAIGFWSPWIEAWGAGSRISLLEWVALEISRVGLLSFTFATPAVILLAALIALIGAVLRVWGTAYLGPGIVNNAEMKAGAVLADGPYRHVRNPLYLGSWCMVFAMSFLMPATGALLVMIVLSILLLRLILGEEAFLTAQLGEPYRAYQRAVPRIFPRLRSNLPRAGRKAHWGRAVLSELNPISVFLVFAIFSWTYNNWLMVRAIVISYGIALVVKALMPGFREEIASAD
jgi:protein-S-isoprenylcysteine O-methyltransferase Ste14